MLIYCQKIIFAVTTKHRIPIYNCYQLSCYLIEIIFMFSDSRKMTKLKTLHMQNSILVCENQVLKVKQKTTCIYFSINVLWFTNIFSLSHLSHLCVNSENRIFYNKKENKTLSANYFFTEVGSMGPWECQD